MNGAYYLGSGPDACLVIMVKRVHSNITEEMTMDNLQESGDDLSSIYTCFVSGAKFGTIVALLTYLLVALK
jgi:hypothetical protein